MMSAAPSAEVTLDDNGEVHVRAEVERDAVGVTEGPDGLDHIAHASQARRRLRLVEDGEAAVAENLVLARRGTRSLSAIKR